jgi:hypothetical protein
VDERIGEQGSPVDYAVFGAGLLLAPTPVVPRTIQVRYRSRPTRMVGDSDYPGIPSAYEDLLLSYALYHAFRSEDDVDMASFYKGEWQQGMAQLRTDLQYPDESQRRQIGGMMGGDAGPALQAAPVRGSPVPFTGFVGGVNYADEPYNLGNGEARDLLNVVATGRGGITKRSGAATAATTVQSGFESLGLLELPTGRASSSGPAATPSSP